ncbi:MAG: DUF11 domain-containing protein, partial [Firmicutes bacterium]|nr:DUF11 domain-containing protein [Bacillota bacterium]
MLLSITATGGTPFSYTGGTPGDPTDPLVINLGTVPAGWSDILEIELLVDPSVRGRISGMAQYGFMRNDATIESDTFDDDWSDNLASWLDEDVLNLSYIFVEKDGPTTAVAGTEIEYEIFVENRGPSTAFNLRVKDWLGPESQQYLTFLGYYVENASGVSCTYSEHWGGVFCNRGDMVPHNGFGTPEGFSIYLRFLVDPSTPVGTVLTDTVEILTDNWEWEYITQIPDPLDPTKFIVVDSVLNWETEITAEANLVATKASVPQKVVAGEQVKYVLTVTNPGPSDAENVFVVDHFGEWLDELEFEISSDPNCQLDINNHVNCWVGTLPAGATWTADIWGRVKPSVFPGTVITNRVAVRSDTPPYTADPDNALWTATETYVLNAADLKVQKFGKPDGEVRAGDLLTYTIIVDNLGPSDAWGPVVQDMLRSDGDFTLVSISSSRPNDTVCSVTPPIGSTDGALDFTCTLVENSDPAPLVVSDRWVLTVVVTANETQDINNTVRVWSEYGLDPDTSNNYALVEHDITDVSDLVVAKAAMGLVAPGEWEENAVTAGLSMVYTVTVANLGPSTAENVVLKDRLPSWLVVTGVEASQGACNTGTPGSAVDPLACGQEDVLRCGDAPVDHRDNVLDHFARVDGRRPHLLDREIGIGPNRGQVRIQVVAVIR